MIQMLRKRLDRKDEGFTLIELMVVVLIIAILLAIAIPTFLGARSRAQNRATESTLRNALTAEKTIYTDAQSYSSTTASLASVEPSLSWVAPLGTAASFVSNTVEVATTGASSNAVCLSTKSGSGTYYGIVDVAQPDSTGGFTAAGTFYFKGAADLTCPTVSSSMTGAGWGTTTTAAGW